MKKLTERTEIATAINFRQYPVIRIDLSDTDTYGVKGTKVLIDNGSFKNGDPYLIEASLRIYNDEKKLTFFSNSTCLKSNFGYDDMEELLEYANAPIIKADQDILVCLVNSKLGEAYTPVVLHTGNHINPNCITPLTLEEYKLSTK